MELSKFAEKYFSEYAGRSVPLDLLLAWLSENHWHPEPDEGTDEDEGTRPVVHSMGLHYWAIESAVQRVVDHGPQRDDMDVWNFFEHDWHKAGPACETHLMQSRKRLVQGNFSGEVFKLVQEKQVGGMSIDGDRYWRKSSTTGREHWCELPPEETCYWSGDPYAPHELGF
jgi:hypothetical protein